MRKPSRRVKFTKAIALHTKIRDQNPSLGYICPGEPHQRSPNAPKFEDRSQEETEWQEQGAREAAWKLAKSVLKLKEHERATFFSPSENRCLPASTLKPEEREFVVDSGASMHMISKKDLSKAEMDNFDEIVQSYDGHNRQWRSASSSSSSSSSSPTVSEIQIRERKDGNSSDISPVPVSNSVDDRSGQPEETTIERSNPLESEIPEWLQEFRENLVDDEIPLQGGSHASSSHEASLEPTTKRREDFG